MSQYYYLMYPSYGCQPITATGDGPLSGDRKIETVSVGVGENMRYIVSVSFKKLASRTKKPQQVELFYFLIRFASPLPALLYMYFKHIIIILYIFMNFEILIPKPDFLGCKIYLFFPKLPVFFLFFFQYYKILPRAMVGSTCYT